MECEGFEPSRRYLVLSVIRINNSMVTPTAPLTTKFEIDNFIDTPLFKLEIAI